MAERAEAYLSRKKNAASGLEAETWQHFQDYYSRKLWHELALAVNAFTNSPPESVDLKEFYDNFISDFEHRINPLQLVEIILPISSFIFNNARPAAFEFLDRIKRTVSKDKLATTRVHVGKIKLMLENKDAQERVVDIEEVRKLIESTRTEVDAVGGVCEVHAPFYKVSSVYLKEMGDYAGYYREALRYLGVEDHTKISPEEKHVHAVLLGFAALLGENIFNFGELLAHPILLALEGSAEKWIVDVLFAFNSGDLDKFRSLERFWAEWDDLKRRSDILYGKIRLLSLMELALSRTSKNREISFSEIAAKAEIKDSEVEHLVMRALARKLIRGSIDEVKKRVTIDWVQPRVLDGSQLLLVAGRVHQWTRDVFGMENLVTENAKEILTRA